MLAPGVPIEAAEVATLATVGATEVEVFRLPKVAVLATVVGDRAIAYVSVDHLAPGTRLPGAAVE